MKVDIEYHNWISNCPAQDEGFGEASFYQGDGFSCRYLERKRHIYRSIYILYGPNIEHIQGLYNFLSWLNGFRFTKVTIDLYKVFFDAAEQEIVDALKKNGFKLGKYGQESQTILIHKDNYNPNKRVLKYVRSVERKYHIEIIPGEQVDDDTLSRCFEIYQSSCQKKGYQLRRSLAYMRSILSKQGGYLAIAIEQDSGQIEGFILSSTRFVEYNSKHLKIMYLVFTAMSEKGKNHHVGYGLTHRMIELGLLSTNVDIVDFFGFGGAHGIFKTKFGGEVVNLPGSFCRFSLL